MAWKSCSRQVDFKIFAVDEIIIRTNGNFSQVINYLYFFVVCIKIIWSLFFVSFYEFFSIHNYKK